MASYDNLYEVYKDFIAREQAYNQSVLDEQVDWYDVLVEVPDHFERDAINSNAKSEASIIKRVALLDVFEHIAAMERLYRLRMLTYRDYFTRQDGCLADENDELDRRLDVFDELINGGVI